MINNNMTQEELDLIFEDPRDVKMKTKEYQALAKLYDSYEMKIPKSGDVVKGTYQGIHNDQHEFYVRGFKDDIRIENKLSESKYLKNTKINDELDLLITNVDNDNFRIDGSISILYESRAHETLKSLTKTDVAVR